MRYFDYAASTPLDPRVAEAMAAAAAKPGNPSSIHAFGRALREDVDRARASVARLLGVGPGAVTFTSGATEANALAVMGAWRAAARAHPGKKLTIVAGGLEHASVAGSLAALAADEGADVVLVGADKDGAASPADVAAAMTPETVLVSVMWANNVLGSIQPVREIGRLVAEERMRRGAGGLPVAFHSDAVQAVRTEAVLPSEAGVDLLTVSAHKMYGPKGVGALVRTSGSALRPLYAGGGQEDGLRSGTENAAGIAGFGRAAGILADEREADAAHAAALRASFLAELAERAPRMEVVAGAHSVPGIIFLRHPGVDGDLLALTLDSAGFAVSAGSACDSGKRKGSRVLAAVLDERRAAHGGIRVSFGRSTGASDISELAAALGAAAK